MQPHRYHDDRACPFPTSMVRLVFLLLSLFFRLFCPHERFAPFNIGSLQKFLNRSKQLNLPQLFQQVVVGNRRQSLYLVTHHEQRSNALDFCTSSFTTQVARCPSESQRMMCSKHMRNAASQMERRYCLEQRQPVRSCQGEASRVLRHHPHHTRLFRAPLFGFVSQHIH